MGDKDDWKNYIQKLPSELLGVIVQRLEFMEDVRRFSAVCKLWKFVVFELENEKPWLLSKYPCLLLAEDNGLDLSAVKVSNPEAILSDMPDPVDESNTTRGLFSLAKQRVYNIYLPEAANKLILGTNIGWLVTLDTDLKINLLHPLSRHQIQLPPVPIPPVPISHSRYKCDENFNFKRSYFLSIKKIVMSSEVPTKNALQHQDTTHLPMIMAIFGQKAILCFARLGDKLWTNLKFDGSTYDFHDIVYHKGKFYMINYCGVIFVCDLDNHDKREWPSQMGKILEFFPIDKWGDDSTYYLIESLSGSHIWVALRYVKGQYFKTDPDSRICGELWYHTINFKVFKLEVHYSNSDEPSCTWSEEEVKDLGNEALFIGRASSTSVASSEIIQPNSIYFTDDSLCISKVGGGHDMGIFNVETGKIQTHFQGISIHPFSPPLWYIRK